MQNKTDKGTSLVSKSLSVINSSSVNCLLSNSKTTSCVLGSVSEGYSNKLL